MNAVAPDFRSEFLTALAAQVEQRLGLHFPQNRHSELLRGVSKACEAAGESSVDDYLAMLLDKGPEHLDRLAPYLTIGESYFFREPRMIALLESVILPGIFEERKNSRKLGIWSAGCSSGEEPYTLAIMLDRLLADRKDWDIKLLATDVNTEVLEKARQGVYRQWSFRNPPQWLLPEYFLKVGENAYQLQDAIRNMVELQHLNLAEDACPSPAAATTDFDLILCRNVLIYFSAEAMENVLRRFRACLREDGWFVTGPSEAGHVTAMDVFHPVSIQGVTVFTPSAQKASLEDCSEAEEIVPVWEEPAALFEPQAEDDPPELAAVQPPVFEEEPALVAPGGEAPSVESAAKAAKEERWSDVVRELQELARQQDLAPEAQELLARGLANMGRLSEALELARQAAGAKPLWPGPKMLLAEIYMEKGAYGEAAKQLQQAVYLEPDAALAHYHLGVLADAAGDKPGARKYYDRALRVLNSLPGDAPAPFAEGMSAARLREIVETAKQ